MKPFIEQRADPYIIRKDGWYYFTASVPEFDRIILRKARTLKELPDAVEKIIWTRHEEGELSCNIWAPELRRMTIRILFPAGLLKRERSIPAGRAFPWIPLQSGTAENGISSGPSGILTSPGTAICISRK